MGYRNKVNSTGQKVVKSERQLWKRKSVLKVWGAQCPLIGVGKEAGRMAQRLFRVLGNNRMGQQERLRTMELLAK